MKWFDGITDLQELLAILKECAAEYCLKADEATRQKMFDTYSTIKLAFQTPKLLHKKLAKKYHSDVGGDDDTMTEINVEFDVFKTILNKAKRYVDNPEEAVDKTAEKVRKQRAYREAVKHEYQSAPDYDFTSEFWESYTETDDEKSDFWSVDFKSAAKNSMDFLIALFEGKTEPVKHKTDTHTKGSRYRRGKIRRGTVWRTWHNSSRLFDK